MVFSIGTSTAQRRRVPGLASSAGERGQSWLARAVAVAVLSVVTAGIACAQTASIAPDLADAVTKDPVAVQRVIVQFERQPSPPLLTAIRFVGGRVCREFSAVDAAVVDISGRAALKLALVPGIRAISPDRPVSACLDTTTKVTKAAEARANGIVGAGVTVAVLDTGVAFHPDLIHPTCRIVGWVDVVNFQPSPYDDNGHGTHVAGIIAGSGCLSSTSGTGTPFYGVAPQANIVGVKVLDARGAGTASSVLAGIDWCILNRDRLNIRVLNLSLGGPVQESYKTDPICQAAEEATAAGLLVVTAAGNRGRSIPEDPNSPPAYATIDCPGNDPYVLTVGATKTLGTAPIDDDAVASYSSRGPSAIDGVLKPDIVAPGNRIISLSASGGYVEMSGTSMAAPVVAGAAALLFSQDRTLTPATVKARLMQTANAAWNPSMPIPDRVTQGMGYLDITAALASTIVTKQAGSPKLSGDSGSGKTAEMGPTDAALWGDSALWLDSALWADSALWLDTALWVDSALWADSIRIEGE